MADPDLLELTKEEPAIIKQKRKGVIVRLGRVKKVDHNWASNSTRSLEMPSWKVSSKPSFNAQNYAMILEANPICLMYPLTHFP